MVSSNFQCTSSNLNRRNKRKAKEEENIKPKRNRRGEKAKNVYQLNLRSKFISSCSFQSFSFPDSIMFYISKNPTTTKLYKKIIQTCKYFFIKNPVIVSPNYPYSFDYDLDKWCIGKTQFDSSSQLICKYWITENFNFTPILPKLYKCDAKKVTLENQVICFNDLSKFTKTAEDISFERVIVKNFNDSIVSIEKIFEAFINVKKFQFHSYSTLPKITSKTFIELLKIPHFSKLQSMNLNSIPDTFDIKNFYVYMKKNKTTKFILQFHKSISEAYKNRLEEIIDEIMLTNVFNYKPPFIDFDGLEEEKRIATLYF